VQPASSLQTSYKAHKYYKISPSFKDNIFTEKLFRMFQKCCNVSAILVKILQDTAL